MPKAKKRKTTHQHHYQSTNGDLSHEEIWDDSALLRSWNDALAEYEFYHSVHARGEDVEEVLRRAEMESDEAGQGKDDAQSKGEEGIEGDEGEIIEDEGEIMEGEQGEAGTAGLVDSRSSGPVEPGIVLETRAEAQAQPVNDTVEADSVKAGTSTLSSDQLLENIKMSYYWAGYYSGLYDAQRQGQDQAQ